MYIDFKLDGWEDKIRAIAEPGGKLEELLKYRSFRYGTVQVKYELFTLKEIEAVYDAAKEMGDRSVMMQSTVYIKYLKNPAKAKMSNLKVFAAALKDFIEENCPNRWIFSNGEYCLPYAVADIKYVEPNKEEQAYVSVITKANGVRYYSGGLHTTFYAGSISGKTIPEILLDSHIVIEDEALMATYREQMEDFYAKKAMLYCQFIMNGRGIRHNSWRDRDDDDGSDFNAVGYRVLNDEASGKRSITPFFNTQLWGEDFNVEVPIHPFLRCFNLDTHEYVDAHTTTLKEYIYDDTLKDKLVLPPSHRDLLDILTQDLSILQGDIIRGKSSGTTILCMGKPGLGKTLTAEAYSEIVHKPLYKVNSGQLGVTPNEVEQNLEKILNRAERWGVVMLIDEADLYIRRRDIDVAHNAIVAAFLRTLEYFHGLLFMTTNRGDDVDDAIVSRCIATIRYDYPDRDAAKKIWQVMAELFETPLPDATLGALLDQYPKISGRDIRELFRLTVRYCKAKGLEPTAEQFISCAQFRGLLAKQGVQDA